MGAFVTAVLRWFFGIFSRTFMALSLYSLTSKIIMVTLFIVVVPIIFNNIFYDLMQMIFNASSTYTAAHNPNLPGTVGFVGLAAYMLRSCGLLDAFAVILAATAIRFLLTWIPFVGPK